MKSQSHTVLFRITYNRVCRFVLFISDTKSSGDDEYQFFCHQISATFLPPSWLLPDLQLTAATKPPHHLLANFSHHSVVGIVSLNRTEWSSLTLPPSFYYPLWFWARRVRLSLILKSPRSSVEGLMFKMQPFIRNVDFVTFLFRQFVNLSDANLQALILGIGSVLALTRIYFFSY